jgi:tetraacyldisaccharide 4'-kinase
MWYRNRRPWLGMLLSPVSLLFRSIITVRRACLQRKARDARLPVPVIIVGNINLGGSGKSPVLIALARRLRSMGYSPGVISRGYGSRAPFYPFMVTAETLPLVGGDEPVMIAQRSACPVVIDSNRLNAARTLIESTGCDLVLSDDGLQHYRLPRDLEIVVVDGQRGLGNGRLLPAGPLREPVSRLDQADWLIVNGASSDPVENLASKFADKSHRMQLRPVAWHRLANGEVMELPAQPWPAATRVHALAGIGNPQRFFDTLRELGLEVIPHSFPDHHQFQLDDFTFADDLPVVMTEKDAVKCRALPEFKRSSSAANYWYLRVDAELGEDFYNALRARLRELQAPSEAATHERLQTVASREVVGHE